MNWNKWVRQVHRWMSVIFVLTIVLYMVIAMGTGAQPAPWVTYLPLAPLFLLLLTGLYLFVLPYAAKWRSRRATPS